MPLVQYKPVELVDSLLSQKISFFPGKEEEQEFVWNDIQNILLSIKENLPSILAQENSSDILIKYKFLAESVTYIRVSLKFFELCSIELGTEFYVKHTRNSMKFYVFGRKFLILATALLRVVFAPKPYLDYSEVSKYNALLAEFTYPRKLYCFDLIVNAMSRLFLFQRGTNFLLLNWELRLECFFICRSSLDYTDLMNRKITDPLFMEKNELIRILSMSYEVLIAELKKEYEKTKQHFFFRNVLILLEELKRLNVLLGNTEKVQWLERNILSWDRISKYGK